MSYTILWRDNDPAVGKRVLVTGGAGFLGSHLCDRLLGAGHHVVCLDDFSTGRAENIAHLRDSSRFRVLRHDVTKPYSVEADEIYNLACPASPPHYQADPVRTMKICVLGALNALGLAQERRIPILQASTSEIYGDPLEHPQRESYLGNVNTAGPRACYDEGKRAAETLFFDYHRQAGLEIKVCRIFNTYGPRMRPDDGRVVSNFVVQALRGESITIYGKGEQTRSFCYVNDLVEGFLRLMDSPGTIGPVNLGNPAEFTVRELADLVIDLTGSRSRIVHRALPQDDPQRRRPDIARAKDALGWEPKVRLREGLAKTIAHFEEQLRLGVDLLHECAA